MRKAVSLLGLAYLFAFGANAAPATPDQDLAAFANGALIEQVSSNYGSGWEAVWLLDENPSTGWASEKGAKGPFEIVISLPERSEIHAISFDTALAENPERSAKNVDVLISDVSAAMGFKTIAGVTLKPAKDTQRFELAAPGTGRWLKLVVRTNNGDPDYSEIMSFRAFGKALTKTPIQNVSGTYSNDQFGAFHLMQTGAQLSGCYEHDGGLVQGGLEDHLLRLTWSENKGAKTGPA